MTPARRHIRKMKAAAHALLGGACALCLRRDDDRGPRLEMAHFKPTQLDGRGRGSKERIRDVLNHPDRYVLLCREPCHQLFDLGSVKIRGRLSPTYLREIREHRRRGPSL